jgi:sporulation protein YlmC with PRC-barrel domain
MIGLDEIIGLEVISSDAKVVGTVEGVGIDAKTWKTPGIRIGLRRGIEDLLGMKKRYLAVEKVFIRTEEVESISDTVILRKPLDLIMEATMAEDVLTAAGSLMGMRVVCCNARYVGMVDNLIFDPDKGWDIPLLQVKLDRVAGDLLNLRHPLLSSPVVSIRTSDIRAIGDMVMMSITLDQLKAFLESQAQVQPLPSVVGVSPP